MKSTSSNQTEAAESAKPETQTPQSPDRASSKPQPSDVRICKHCGRAIIPTSDGWIDPQATGDDRIWRETCDAHDTFTAEHEPS